MAGNTAKGTLLFVRSFKHWRSGKIIRAKNYGKKAFPIFGKRKKK